MLVLSRRLQQVVYIGDGANRVAVQVVSIDRGKVRLAFTAAREVKIVRSELVDRPRPARPD